MYKPRSFSVVARRLLLLISLACFALTVAAAEGGDALDLARYRGKVVVVDFWASWCEPCRHSFPWLNAMQAKYGARGLVIIGVNVDRERGDADRFLHDVPADFPIVYDPAGALATRYDVPGMPTSFVIDPKGEIVGRHIGFKTGLREEREAELQKLLETVR
jgi:thiol-disulfide isomerase/thioredoxin